MERNNNNDLNFSTGSTTGAGSGASGATGTDAGFGGTSASQAGSQGTSDFGSAGTSGASSTSGGTTGGTTGGTGADAQNRFNDLKDKAGDRFGQVKERAGELKATLADKLEAGAERLRARGGSAGGAAYATGAGSMAATEDHMARAGETLAGGLQKTAEFLREGDLQASIEEQVKTHPGRTLLIAVGLGYLLGKALRR